MVNDFLPGQRWINDAELQLGLGTILTVEHRTITILFMATGETRVYAKATAPLVRVTFAPGDKIKAHEGPAVTVTEVSESQGLLTYYGVDESGESFEITEGMLDNTIQLNRPTERLFSGQLDRPKWYDLRYQTLIHAQDQAQSDLRGLLGARTSLLPHQLYIAHEVANRYAPRVLLADEVGLGKTVEAGLILQQQLLSGQVKRVLIVVPDSLVHQWLVEMLRRFNLQFSIFDRDRCEAVADEADNPFNSAQLALCSLDFLVAYPRHHQQALDVDWDLLIVDEAHHLLWTPEQSSAEYNCIEQLALKTKGLILLTATPEQLGKTSHFARLRLLDAGRFPDYERFVEEENHYVPTANLVEKLLQGEALNADDFKLLHATVNEPDSLKLLDRLESAGSEQANLVAERDALVQQLLDRHGTGRVLFRNTRAAVQGFPEREVHAYPLPVNETYQAAWSALSEEVEPQLLLCPEHWNASEEPGVWTRDDPRIDWLIALLKEHHRDKILVITHHASSAMDIAEALRLKVGLHAALFHEKLSIVERDRAAAYFADVENGSPVLICSEIGSEGRNFQFAHHLVLFDLPYNPDLLEQRIGRLDRIGQTQTIQIHVPYLEGTPQEVQFRWYHEGLQAFEHTCPAGHSVAVEVDEVLRAVLRCSDQASLDALLSTTESRCKALNEALHEGRDRLLEYSSCPHRQAQALTERVQNADGDDQLMPYLERLFDCCVIDCEEQSEQRFLLRPSEKTYSGFPSLPEDGMTFTYDRDTALANEDAHFMTWEHPMATGAMEMVLSSEMGNCSMVTVKQRGLTKGTIFMECLFMLEGIAEHSLQAERYLPPSMIRVFIDQSGNDYSEKLSHEVITQVSERVDKNTAKKVVKAYKALFRDMVSKSETVAKAKMPEILQSAHERSKVILETEVNRLKALRQVNPNVREEEIAYFEELRAAVDDAVEAANLRLDALRVVVAL